jgi:hypothetical protein
MNLDKDSYEYLTNFADDRTVMALLSANKKFNDPKLFERILMKRYPSLLQFKKEKESWKLFYLKMIKAIAAMKEDFDIDYELSSVFDPDRVYNYLRLLKEAIYQMKNLFLIKSDLCFIEIGIINKETKWNPKVERDRFIHIYLPDDLEGRNNYLVRKYQEPVQNILMEETFSSFPSIKELYKFIVNEKIFDIIVYYQGDPRYLFDINN